MKIRFKIITTILLLTTFCFSGFRARRGVSFTKAG